MLQPKNAVFKVIFVIDAEQKKRLMKLEELSTIQNELLKWRNGAEITTNFICLHRFKILGGDYMIPVARDEILSHFTGISAVL